VRTVLLLLPFLLVAVAADMAAIRKDLRSKDPDRIRGAIDALVRQDDREAVDALVAALRDVCKVNDKVTSKFDRDFASAMEEIAAATSEIPGLSKRTSSPAQFQAEMARINKRLNEGFARTSAALDEYLPHAILYDGTRLALRKFKSEASVERLREIVGRERGSVRHWVLVSFLSRKDASIVPTLLELSEDRDARTRAVAVRCMIPHVGVEGVRDAVLRCAADDSWQVRRGAFRALAAAEDKAQLEKLRVDAKGDDDRMLAALLGKQESEPVAFGLPLVSLRVRFVVDLSTESEAVLPTIRQELTKALQALPDGAEFELIALPTGSPRFSRGPKRMGAGVRRDAIAWVERLKAGGSADDSMLDRLLVPDYDHPSKGKRVFDDLPDSVYLILGPAKEYREIDSFSNFAGWNAACDATLYVRVLGGAPPENLRAAIEGVRGICRTD
jgi:HEAT repeat protein